MNIKNLVVPLIVATASLSGCAAADQSTISLSATSATQTVHEATIDYACSPLLDANWIDNKAPQEVVDLRAKGWEASTIKVDELVVTYFRDCSADVRGPVSKHFPLGPLLGDVSCNGDTTWSMFGFPKLSDSEDYTKDLIDHATRVINQLRQSDVCKTHVIIPIS